MNRNPEFPAPDPERAIAGLEVLGSTGRTRPPVEAWHPENVREIDMAIDREGNWSYLGSPIGRPEMVRLFASILRREDDGRYALVTPVEKCLIQVADVPFVAVGLSVHDAGPEQVLAFTTNLGDTVHCDDGHALRFSRRGDAYVPYVTVRSGLEARIGRAVYYDLMAMCDTAVESGQQMLGLWSGGTFWTIAPAGEVAE